MAWPTLSTPVAGTVITVAWAVQNVINPLTWLRIMTGNADPPGSDYVVGSLSTTTTTWKRVTHDMIAATEQFSVGMMTSWTSTAVTIPTGWSASGIGRRGLVNVDGVILTSAGQTGGQTTIDLHHAHAFTHDHNMPHTHTQAHTHPYAHNHAVPNHLHTGAVVIVIASHTSVKINAQISSGGSEHVEQDHSHGISSQTLTMNTDGATTTTTITGTGSGVTATDTGAVSNASTGSESTAATAGPNQSMGDALSATTNIENPYYSVYHITKTSQT